jgi:LETM1-like protein
MISLPIVNRAQSIHRIAPQWLRAVPQHRSLSRSPEATESPVLLTVPQQPLTLWERTKSFSNGVYRLYQDYVLYSNIHDAAQTAVNTHRHHWSQRRSSSSLEHSSIIPWRQQAQQRQFVLGLYTVAPVVTLFMVPVVGYLPMFLSVAWPRQLLSRHFYNEYEILHYNQLAYQQRLVYYPRVQAYWPKNIWQEGTTEDVAADMCAAYQTYFREGALPTKKTSFSLAELDCYPRDYLLALSLCSGLYDTLPGPVQYWCAAQCTPTWYLRRFLRQVARTIAQDDAVLWYEEHVVASSAPDGPSFVHSMTTVELMDACLLRGLPILHVSREDMCVALRQHLRIMAAVRTTLAANVHAQAIDVSERMGLFALYASILRQH